MGKKKSIFILLIVGIAVIITFFIYEFFIKLPPVNPHTEFRIRTELSNLKVGFEYYYEHFKEYPFDYDNFDGDPNYNDSEFEGVPCPDFGLLASEDISKYLDSIGDESEREVVIANIICVWALSFHDPEKEIGLFVTFDENRLIHIGDFEDNQYLHIDDDIKKPYKSKYGKRAFVYNDRYGNPYVFDINWRWNISSNPKVTFIARDEHDYVGRHFCGNTDSIASISPKYQANTKREFFRRGHWLRKNVLAPVDIWSRGPDGKTDPNNNGRDDNNDGKADDPDELVDDIVSWN